MSWLSVPSGGTTFGKGTFSIASQRAASLYWLLGSMFSRTVPWNNWGSYESVSVVLSKDNITHLWDDTHNRSD